MNCFKKINKVTLPIACLFFSINCNAQEPTIIESTLHKPIYAEAMQNVEFEKFLIRYATHYPTATIDTTKKLAEQTLTNLCIKQGKEKKECETSFSVNNIESLLTDVAIRKLRLSSSTQTTISELDKNLTIDGVANIEDKYTRFTYADEKVSAKTFYSTSELSKGGDKLKINTFDSKLGCVDEKNLENIQSIKQLDLRDNNGGDIKCTLDILSKFLPKGRHHVATIYTINGEEELWVQGLRETDNNKKVIRVNKNTASSAEIFTIALENTGWEIDGLPMMNKRSIQARFETNFGSYHLTIGKFVTMQTSK